MSNLVDEFIRPCEAIKILDVSRETLRTNYAKMRIRRTAQKPYRYSKIDCLKWVKSRFEVEETQDDPRYQRLVKRLKKQK
jgi:hypothetical protein